MYYMYGCSILNSSTCNIKWIWAFNIIFPPNALQLGVGYCDMHSLKGKDSWTIEAFHVRLYVSLGHESAYLEGLGELRKSKAWISCSSIWALIHWVICWGGFSSIMKCMSTTSSRYRCEPWSREIFCCETSGIHWQFGNQ